MAEPLLTVVVCTHDRPDDLERCLTGLAALEGGVDLIVVDSASSAPLQSLVNGFSGSFSRLMYHYEPVAGLARARNRGLELAQTDLVAFIDDDAVPDPDWAQRVAGPFADASVACVGGACRAAFDSARPSWLSDRLLQFAGVTRFGVEGRRARSSSEYPFGANMCFRRGPLLEAGGFPENLGRMGTNLLSGEEHQVVDALRRLGWSIWLEPSAIVGHRVTSARCRAGYYWRRLWWQGVSRARVRRSPALAARLLAAAIVRVALWALTGDRVYLFRLAETAGYVVDCLRPRAAAA
jgi:glycosyltransferase involved in cell wall biosynthesis